MRKLSLLFFGLVIASGPVHALTVSGRLTSSLYTYEGIQTDTTTTSYLRVYQGLRLDLGRLFNPDLSFHTYMRATTDLADQADDDPRLRFFNAYLLWKKAGYRVQLGRQRVMAGVGNGSIDGLRTDMQVAGIDLTAFAGLLLPLDSTPGAGSWSEGNLWGVRAVSRRFFGTTLGLSFASREREPVPYATPGRYSGVLAAPPAVVQRLVGLDLNRRFAGGHDIYGRLVYDVEDTELRRTELSGRYLISGKLSAQAEWIYRLPDIYYNSIFSVFPSETYQELGGRLLYRVNPGLQLAAHFAHLLYDGDSAQRFGLTASIGEHYSIGYYRSMGYARASDGLVGSIFYSLTRKLQFRGEMDLASYERDELSSEREDLATGSLGFTYRPTRRTSVDLQLQGLRNPFYSSDARLFLRGSWRFFKAPRAR